MTYKSTLILTITALPLFFFLSSCGGGGGGSSLPSVAPAPAVASITPANLSQSVGLNDPIVVKFNQSVADANLNGAKVTVSVISEFGDIVTGSTVYDTATQTVTFTPDQNSYAIYAKYNVVVDLIDSDNQAVVNYLASFTTRDGVWSSTVIVNPSSVAQSSPLYSAQVSVNKSGQAFAHWTKQGAEIPSVLGNTYNSDLMVSHYDSVSNWELSGTKIDSDDSGGIARKKLVLSDNGNAVAIWIAGTVDSSDTRLWTNYFNPPNTIWNRDLAGNILAQSLSKDSTSTVQNAQTIIYDNAVAIDKNGNAIALWDQFQSRGVYVNRFNMNQAPPAWSTNETKLNLLVNSVAKATNAKIVFDDSGNANVIWLFGEPINDRAANAGSILAVYYDNNISDWSKNIDGNIVPKKLNLETYQGNALGNASNFRIASNKKGDAILVYEQIETITNNNVTVTNVDIWARRYDSINGWIQSPVKLENLAGRCNSPTVDMNENGDAIVAWLCANGTYTNIYRPGIGWDKSSTKVSAKNIVPGDTVIGFTRYASVAIDPKGNAFVVWLHKPEARFNNSRLQSARYASGIGWETYANDETYFSLDSNAYITYSIPQIRADKNGNAIVIVAKTVSGKRDAIIYNYYRYSKGWNMSGGLGKTLVLDENIRNYEIGINGLGNFEFDDLGRIIVVSVSNSFSNKGNTPVRELIHKLHAFNYK